MFYQQELFFDFHWNLGVSFHGPHLRRKQIIGKLELSLTSGISVVLVRSDFLVGPIQNIIHVRAWAEAFGVNTLVHMSVLTGRGCHR